MLRAILDRESDKENGVNKYSNEYPPTVNGQIL